MSEEIEGEENERIGQTFEHDEMAVNSLGVCRPRHRRRVRSIVRGKSLTKQADRDRANIHKILSKFEKTGLLPQRVAQPIEGQVPEVESYHQAMNIIVTAQQAFDQISIGS